MNTLQFLQRLLRHTTQPEIGNAPADLLLTALEKANEALEQAYDILPPKYTESAEGFELLAPADITLTLTANSKTVSGYTFAANQIGCSLVISSDNIVNTVTATDSLLLPAGVSGSVSARLYYDAVQLDRGIRSLVSDPLIAATSGCANPTRMQRWEPHSGGGIGYRPWHQGRHHIYLLATYNPGTPYVYHISGNRSSRPRATGQPLALVNVWPMPLTAHRLTIDAQWSPTLLGMSDWKTPAELPIDDRFANHLAAIAEARMTATRYWACRELKEDVLRQGTQAEIALSRAPSDLGLTSYLARTAPGY